MNPIAMQTLVVAVGWTLLYFLWQGLAIAAIFAASLRFLHRAAPRHRYLAGCLALALLAAAPAVTLPRVMRQNQLSITTASQFSIAAQPKIVEASQPSTIVIAHPVPRQTQFAARLEKLFPYLVLVWVAGVALFSLRLFTGWLQIQKLKRFGASALDQPWPNKLAELAERLALRRPVRLLQSALVEVPTVIGWLRPVILVPASCLAGMSAAQLESILAHELAHIRRHDYVVNLLQTLLETFFFYHPAVWWVSRRVREERELCCDDLAVEICGDRLTYARALAALEELRVVPMSLALAASGSPLLPRIRRLAAKSASETNRPAWPVAGIVLLIFLAAITFGLRGNSQTQNPANPPGTFPGARPSPPHGSKARQAILDKLERIRLDTVQFDHVPLADVLIYLTDISKSRDPDHAGLNFVIDRQHLPTIDPTTGLPTTAGQPDAASATITINPPLHDLRLADAIDAIARCSDQPLAYSILDYAIAFRLGSPFETRVFHVDPNTFKQGLDSVTGIPFGNTSTGANGGGAGSSGAGGNTGTTTIPRVNPTAIPGVSSAPSGRSSSSAPNITLPPDRQFLSYLGLDYNPSHPAKPVYAWNDRTGSFPVKSSAKFVKTISVTLRPTDYEAPEVNLKVRIISLSGDPTNQPVNSFWQATNQSVDKITGILTADQAALVIDSMKRRSDAVELSAPGLTTETGRQVQVQTDFSQSGVPTNYITSKGVQSTQRGTNQTAFSPLPHGIVLDMIPYASADQHFIDLTVIPTINFATNGTALPGQETANATVHDGDTMVIGGVNCSFPYSLNSGGVTSRFKRVNSLYFFITPTLIHADGTRINPSTVPKK